MKILKVKYNAIDFDGNGLVRLKAKSVKTVIKHNYNRVRLDGKIYSLDIIYNMPKNKGYLPAIYITELK